MIQKVLVATEGVSEIGREDHSDGSLVVLIKRILGDPDLVCQSIPISSSEIGRFKPKGKHTVYEKRLLGCLIYALNNGYDALVVCIDRDGDEDRMDGIRTVQDSHYAFAQLPRALGIAIESYESWLLSDEVSLSRVANVTIQRQPDPEKLPPGHSKRLLESLIGTQGKAELYLEITRIISLDVVCERCPKSFKPFLESIQKLAS